MPASRKRGTAPAKGTTRGGPRHHAHNGAPVERWGLLGREFHARRLNLGYTTRESFAIARGLITAKGAPNVRMIISVENNERQNYAPGRLEQFALAYEVTRESVYALLDGKTDELEPARRPGAPPSPFAAPALPPPPPGSEIVREAPVRPYADPIWLKLIELRDRGITGPSGAQLGLSPFHAKVWDDAAYMPLEDRVWLLGTVLRNADMVNEGRRPDATSA